MMRTVAPPEKPNLWNLMSASWSLKTMRGPILWCNTRTGDLLGACCVWSEATGQLGPVHTIVVMAQFCILILRVMFRNVALYDCAHQCGSLHPLCM